MSDVSFIDKLEKDIADCLRAHPFFSNVGVIEADAGDSVTRIKTQLAKLHIVVIIEVLTGKVTSQNTGGKAIDLFPSLLIVENATINRGARGSGKTTAHVVEAIFNVFAPEPGNTLPILLQGWAPVSDGSNRVATRVNAKAQAGWLKTG